MHYCLRRFFITFLADLDKHLVDAVAVRIDDLEPCTPMHEACTGFGYVPQMVQYETPYIHHFLQYIRQPSDQPRQDKDVNDRENQLYCSQGNSISGEGGKTHRSAVAGADPGAHHIGRSADQGRIAT